MKLHKHSKGVQLTISYVVTIIIMLFIIILGFRFLASGIESAEYGIDRITKQQLAQIEQELLINTQKVSLPAAQATVSSGAVHIFGLGVKNNLGQRTEFTVSILFNEAKDREGKKFTPQNIAEWTLKKELSFNFGDLETKVIPLAIATPGAKEGEYRFDVTVKCSLSADVCNPYAQRVVTIRVE